MRLDAALNQYSRLASNIAGTGQSNGSWPGQAVEEGRRDGVKNDEEDHIQMEQEIERLLAEVRGCFECGRLLIEVKCS